MDMLEIGFYSAVTVYGLIAAWTVLARLRWLPTALVRLVHWPLNRLGRIPYVGRLVNGCRRYPFSLGIVLAAVVGATLPYFVLSVFWAFQAALLAGAVWLGLRYGGEVSERETSTQGHKLYYSRHGDGEIVPGYDVDADPGRPWLGG